MNACIDDIANVDRDFAALTASDMTTSNGRYRRVYDIVYRFRIGKHRLSDVLAEKRLGPNDQEHDEEVSEHEYVYVRNQD